MNEIAAAYLSQRTVSDLYAKTLCHVANGMGKAGITPKTINGERLNRWLTSLSCSDGTIANKRRMALTLWRWAFESSLTDSAPRGVLRVRVRRKPTEAWTRDQCSRLVKSVDSFSGTMRKGCSRAEFWGCFFRAAYETGLRFSDLHGLDRSALGEGCIFLTMNKTGRPIVRPISRDLEARLIGLAGKSKTSKVFAYFLNRKNTFKSARVILDGAGAGGSLRYFRRSGATHCEIERAGSAQQYLGHATPGLAARHYIDHRQMAGTMVCPPALG